ncbi:MAG TPA: carboxyl transferase domain-containing protein [Acidimicrobiia bacterium]|nr:carboxyl transferase domain-containing protein [Acidimicrobiia bacterium]
MTEPRAPTPVFGHRSPAVEATLRELDGRPVSWFSLDGGKHRGAIGTAEGQTIERAVRLATELGIPIVGRVASSGADVNEGVAALHAWGRVAKALADASGVVPIVLVLVGPAVSGPALLLGIADHVIMTADAFAYVTGPDVVVEFTGVPIDRDRLGGAAVHDRESGVAAMVVHDEDDALLAAGALLAYLPPNHLDDPPVLPYGDPVERDCATAAAAVPARATAAYDVRDVIDDVLDVDSLLELRRAYAPSMVTGLGRLDGHSVGIVANQPMHFAGTIDIEAARKAARFVQWCDCFNVPLITFVDTSGYAPGTDQEWRGIIRHGAELLHAYAASTVPRLCVVLRKAYGGAYVVMDSRGLGADWCVAWPTAEIAVMGAPPAVRIIHRRKLDAIDHAGERARVEAELTAEYEARFLNPYVAAERGYVDDVIPAVDTRRALVAALERLGTKREHQAHRRHSNTPL